MRKLPPIRLLGYSAIIFGKESEQAQEKRNEKSEADLPKKVYPAIRVFEYNPRLSFFLLAPKGHLLATCKLSAIIPVDVLLARAIMTPADMAAGLFR